MFSLCSNVNRLLNAFSLLPWICYVCVYVCLLAMQCLFCVRVAKWAKTVKAITHIRLLPILEENFSNESLAFSSNAPWCYLSIHIYICTLFIFRFLIFPSVHQFLCVSSFSFLYSLFLNTISYGVVQFLDSSFLRVVFCCWFLFCWFGFILIAKQKTYSNNFYNKIFYFCLIPVWLDSDFFKSEITLFYLQ